MNIVALLAGLFSGIAGAMGLGGGAVLIIFLDIFTNNPQLQNQGINIIFFIPIAITALIIYAKHREIEFKAIWKIALGGLLGSVLGLFLTSLIGGAFLTKLFGGLLIAMGLKQIFTK